MVQPVKRYNLKQNMLAFYTSENYCISIHCTNKHVEADMYNRLSDNAHHYSTKATYSDGRLLRIINVADSNTVSVNSTGHSLLQLFKQHQHQQGWILLIAPSYVPNKAWAEQHQLSLNNVLVVHQKQISDLPGTIMQALSSASCKVVINFASQLDAQHLDTCRKLALSNNTWFYQYEQLHQSQIAH
ncbi:hypothetical protein MN202_13920 [Rheinheimera muenzenbergensis]|uniref:Cell division inhibitor SulA n=1 Tax=Rheinheimera muenzenbergensis TaxID=1193628 RepID=A0ABU8C998_9GAMM